MCRHTAGVMVQLWALLLPLGFGGVAIIGQLQGLTAETMGPSQRVSITFVGPCMQRLMVDLFCHAAMLCTDAVVAVHIC
jgi:hypothetical protein